MWPCGVPRGCGGGGVVAGVVEGRGAQGGGVQHRVWRARCFVGHREARRGWWQERGRSP